MLTPTFANLLELSIAERIQLVEDLWDSIVASSDQTVTPETNENSASSQVKRQLLQVEQQQVTIELPASFVNHRVELIAVKVDETHTKQAKRRRPHPAIAGKGRTLGDLVGPIVEEREWEQL